MRKRTVLGLLILSSFFPIKIHAENDKMSYTHFCQMLERPELAVIELYLTREKYELNEPCPGQQGFLGTLEGELPLVKTLTEVYSGDLQKRASIAELLIRHGASLNHVPPSGVPVLLSIWQKLPVGETKTFLEFAIKRSADFKAKIGPAQITSIRFKSMSDPFSDDTGVTALMISSSSKGVESQMALCAKPNPPSWGKCEDFLAGFKTLINVSDINAQDAYGRTALHRAVDYNLPATVKMLVQKGADVKAKDFADYSVEDYAVSRGNPVVLQALAVLPEESSGIPVEPSVHPATVAAALPETKAEMLTGSSPPTDLDATPPSQKEVIPPVQVPLTFAEAQRALNSGQTKKARDDFVSLADKGDFKAAYEAARLFAKGQGGERDFARAKLYFEKAAAKGHPKATFSLGLMYLKGDGVAKDRARAEEYLRQAAKLGSQEASRLLANM